MMTSPALAPIFPALRTPTPASVPTRVILPAYMPRAGDVEREGGAAPLPALASPGLVGVDLIAPVVILSVLANGGIDFYGARDEVGVRDALRRCRRLDADRFAFDAVAVEMAAVDHRRAVVSVARLALMKPQPAQLDAAGWQ